MNLTVIIATSQQRTEWLISRSLLSVYNQLNIDKQKCKILIIDDNEVRTEFAKIKDEIQHLRDNKKLKSKEFSTTVLRNKRTPFMSGTGAWNTGIFESHKQHPEGYISILDDDDEYLPYHLFNCVNSISKNTIAIFQRLLWKNEDSTIMNLDLTKDKLVALNFFVGNPGVQGSNMFFKTQSLINIGGFDETLPNTTDRDLMIRFLWKYSNQQIKVLETIGVIHYNHKYPKVNSNIPLKQQGLDLFYKKYRAHFAADSYQKSLIRAKKYFNYIPIEER